MSDNVASVGELIRRWTENEANVIVAGRNKSGKTTLASALCGVPVPEEIDPTLKLLYNRSTGLHYNNVTVWDACGMFEGILAWRSDVAMKKMKEIKSLKDGKNNVLIYTIPVNETRFVEDPAANLDFCCMRRLTEEFSSSVWDNAVIAFTFVNEGFQAFKPKRSEEGEEAIKQAYITSIKKREKRVRDFLQKELIPEEKVKSLPIICVGLKNETTAPVLEHSPAGESWILNAWKNITYKSPTSSKLLLLNYCFDLLFKGPYLYADSFFSLMKLQGEIYQSKACEVENLKPCSDIGLAYAFLHFLQEVFYNYHNFKQEASIKMISSDDSFANIKFWRALNTRLNIHVTGADHSGKTALINSMLYGKPHISESPENYGTWTLECGNVSCSFQEISLRSLHSVNLGNSSLLLVCMMLDDTEENMTRTLNPVVDKRPSNLQIVFTFSAVNLSGKTWDELVLDKTQAIKRILKHLGMDEAVVDSILVSLASYHNDLTIPGDHSGTHWIMNTWLNSISSAKLTSQAAMVYFVNYYLYTKKESITLEHRNSYKKHLIRILIDMIQSHCTSYDKKFP